MQVSEAFLVFTNGGANHAAMYGKLCVGHVRYEISYNSAVYDESYTQKTPG